MAAARLIPGGIGEKLCEYVIKWMCGASLPWSRTSDPE
jgi:hypothetical protein